MFALFISFLLLAIAMQSFYTNRRIHKIMAAIDDLNASLVVLSTAVGDASTGLRDLAAKLTSSTSINPGDVESAAAKINAIAAGLETVVAGVGEPVTTTETPPPADTPPATDTPPADETPPPAEAVSTSTGTDGAQAS